MGTYEDTGSAGMRARIARPAVQAALFFVALGTGGSFYEHIVIDTVWPSNLQVVQPEQGGIDRKLFWIPIHGLITLTIVAATWATWRHREVRRWVLIALGAYLAMRVWTALYFIPEVMEFEQLPSLSPEDAARARRWVVLSVIRSLLLALSCVALWRAALLQYPLKPGRR